MQSEPPAGRIVERSGSGSRHSLCVQRRSDRTYQPAAERDQTQRSMKRKSSRTPWMMRLRRRVIKECAREHAALERALPGALPDGCITQAAGRTTVRSRPARARTVQAAGCHMRVCMRGELVPVINRSCEGLTNEQQTRSKKQKVFDCAVTVGYSILHQYIVLSHTPVNSPSSVACECRHSATNAAFPPRTFSAFVLTTSVASAPCASEAEADLSALIFSRATACAGEGR